MDLKSKLKAAVSRAKQSPMGDDKPKKKKGGTVKPTYSDIKGSGFNSFKTPTAKDSSDYKKGFEQGLKKSPLKQYDNPSGATVRGYNEGFRTAKKPTGVSTGIKKTVNKG